MKTPRNAFKHALDKGEQQYGFWLGLCNPLSAELCGLCGYDWLLIDAEHAPNDLSAMHAQLLAIDNTPSQAVVRLVDDSASLIKQVLDLGAQTLLVPMVETAAQAEALVSAMHYPPRGTRGVGTALARAARWNQVEGYFDDADGEMCLLIQVESVRALDNLDSILEVAGVDGVFVGPADLAASMGHLGNPAHPDVKAAVEDALGRIRAAGKAAGTLATNKALARHYEACGAQFVALGVDTQVLANTAKSILANHRASGDSPPPQEPGNGAY
ncbi:aldolase/citrate lyase family protein [Parahaliea mediterranea]|uniref:HpcH/HpaI aldolase/citrate lyase family protein n=1 Tax=Parahaliea mediterranea TaxID=651086 RepID=A0A939DFY1_9GAMM|nr:HpcH/HpaI aldolase/citrate lyase family protein [Parahaliea mediterranea]MBN7797319.1 HpcH/HpaI aldolase/citrate lyase family protein [Parahaliea mediterranea]